MAAARRDAAVVIAAPTWNDVLPTVILEAMSAGRAVLGTAVGGIPYLLGGATSPGSGPAGWPGRNRKRWPPALPIARAEAVERGVVARERYLRYFHPDVLIAQLIDVYSALSANSDRAPR